MSAATSHTWVCSHKRLIRENCKTGLSLLPLLLALACQSKPSVLLPEEESVQVELDWLKRSLSEQKLDVAKKHKVTISVHFAQGADGDRILASAKNQGFNGTWYSSPMNEYLSGYLTKSITPTEANLATVLTQARNIAHANRAVQWNATIE